MRAVRDLDPFHQTRTALSILAENTAEWAGLPMPIEGERLVVEPSYPWADIYGSAEPELDPSEADVWKVRNRFYSRRFRADIVVLERDGRVRGNCEPAFHSIAFALRTMGCSVAWGIEQEGKAVQLLGTMLRHYQFKCYLLTGMFLERSPRSGVTYVFRKLRPTVALAPTRPGDDPAASCRILCCLCQHPIAYYRDSWAGAMCPTDDVVAALALMRGDEAMFWKRSTQHPPYRPEAGL